MFYLLKADYTSIMKRLTQSFGPLAFKAGFVVGMLACNVRIKSLGLGVIIREALGFKA